MLKRSTKQLDSMRIFVGFALAMLLDLLSAVGITIFIYYEYCNENHIAIWAFITHFLAVYIGVWYTISKERKTAMINAAIVCIGYYSIQLIASMLVFEGATWTILPLFCVTAMGCGCAIIISNKPKKTIRKRRKRL